VRTLQDGGRAAPWRGARAGGVRAAVLVSSESPSRTPRALTLTPPRSRRRRALPPRLLQQVAQFVPLAEHRQAAIPYLASPPARPRAFPRPHPHAPPPLPFPPRRARRRGMPQPHSPAGPRRGRCPRGSRPPAAHPPRGVGHRGGQRSRCGVPASPAMRRARETRAMAQRVWRPGAGMAAALGRVGAPPRRGEPCINEASGMAMFVFGHQLNSESKMQGGFDICKRPAHHGGPAFPSPFPPQVTYTEKISMAPVEG
jgi:hypothetical protein